MSEQNPILDALQVSVIVNRRDQTGQVAWTEWRANVASGCPADPGSIVMTGADGLIDSCLLPNTSGITIQVSGVPTPVQNLVNFKAGAGLTVAADNAGGVTYSLTVPPLTSLPFGQITTGTNVTATMTVGTGATLTFSGTGIVNANRLNSIVITNNIITPPTVGQVLTISSTSPETATWEALPAIPFNLIATGTNTGHTLTVGNTASLTFTGTGVVNANELFGVALNGVAPSTGMVLTATSATTAAWEPLPTSSTVSVNGVAVTNPNFNNTTPAAPGGFTNVLWQTDGSGNVSAYYATSGGGSSAFNAITSGTNTTATMTLGTGASLTFSGTGVVNANEIYGVAVSNTAPTTGQVLTATSATTAQWQTPTTGTTNMFRVTVDFGSDTGPITRITDVTTPVAATWITSSSTLLCTILGIPTSNHGADDGLFEGLTAQAEDLVPGVGFTLRAYSPLGSWGQYVVAVVGM